MLTSLINSIRDNAEYAFTHSINWVNKSASYLVERVEGAVSSLFSRQESQEPPLDVTVAIDRLRTVNQLKETELKLYIPQDNDNTCIGKILSRLLLEHIYDRSLAQESARGHYRTVMRKLHPDKNPSKDATELFQLYDKIVKTADIDNSSSTPGWDFYIYNFLLSCLIRRAIVTVVEKTN